MDFNLSLFLMALGLACVMEALPWLISPERMREMLLNLSQLSDDRLRTGGILMLALGIAICAAGRYLKGN